MKKILALILILFTFSGCNASNSPIVTTFFSMDTQCNITVFEKNKDTKSIELAVKELETKLSKTNSNSEIYKFNNLLSKSLSSETKQLISTSDEISKNTNGAFDIRLGAIMDLWGFSSNPKVPSQQDIIQAIDNKNKYDLGAVAKGYASDVAINILKGKGVKSAIVALGGNVGLIGKKPNNEPFNVGIKYPSKTVSDPLLTIKTTDCFIVTSGNYERSFDFNNKNYHHIIDPKTGYPVDNELVSVTIINKNGTQADALSTALFVMGLDKAIEFHNSNEYDFDFVLITKDKKIYCSHNILNNVELNEKFGGEGYEIKKG
jgi:thiamine biosynthesis lipoprotein